MKKSLKELIYIVVLVGIVAVTFLDVEPGLQGILIMAGFLLIITLRFAVPTKDETKKER